MSVIPALLLAILVVFAVSSAQAAPGDLDTSFGTGGKVLTSFGSHFDEVDGLALQPDGKIVAGGYVEITSSDSDFGLARYNPDGSLDPSFGTGGKVTTAFGTSSDYVSGIVLQPDGKIVAAGRGNIGGTSAFGLARYNPNGSLDTTFGSAGLVATLFGTGTTRINGVRLQPDRKIVAVGISHNGSNFDFALARYNPDGSLDTSFGAGGKVTTDFASDTDFPYAVALQPDGKIVAVGYTYKLGSGYVVGLARYNPDGSLDTSFGSGGRVTTVIGATPPNFDFVYAIALQPDGKIVVVGESRTASSKYDAALVRYNPDGSLDTSFGSGGKVTTAGTGNDGFEAVVLQLNRKIVAGGWSAQGTPPLYQFGLARYNPNGSLDTSFGTGGKVATAMGPHDDFVSGVALQSDGKIVAGGGSDMTMTSADYQFALARFQGDTCVVPKLKGRKLAAAKSLIKRKQCKVGKVKKRFSKKVKKGRVISESPAAGKNVAAATKVNLVSSKGPKRR